MSLASLIAAVKSLKMQLQSSGNLGNYQDCSSTRTGIGVITMSQWDNCEINESIRIRQQTDEYNRQASELLPVEENIASTKTRTVINRRSGARVKTSETLYEYNERMKQNCIRRYWTRTPRSNSNSFVYHTVQNDSSSFETVRDSIVLETRLYRG